MTTTSERGFPWILTVLSAALLAVLIGLGVWQVQRLAWKEGLIDRGFVADEISARPPVDPTATGPIRITAVMREAPAPNWMSPPPQNGRFFARDPEAMAEALNIDGAVDARVLFAETSTNPEWAALRPAVPPAAFSNNHLGYAITWFGLAAALMVYYGLMLKRRLRPPPTQARRSGQDND